MSVDVMTDDWASVWETDGVRFELDDPGLKGWVSCRDDIERAALCWTWVEDAEPRGLDPARPGDVITVADCGKADEHAALPWREVTLQRRRGKKTTRLPDTVSFWRGWTTAHPIGFLEAYEVALLDRMIAESCEAAPAADQKELRGRMARLALEAVDRAFHAGRKHYARQHAVARQRQTSGARKLKEQEIEARVLRGRQMLYDADGRAGFRSPGALAAAMKAQDDARQLLKDQQSGAYSEAQLEDRAAERAADGTKIRAIAASLEVLFTKKARGKGWAAKPAGEQPA